MNNAKKTIVFKTKQSIRAILTSVLGIIFWGTIAYIISSEWKIDDELNPMVGSIIMSLFVLLLVYLMLSMVLALLKITTISLTSKEMIVRRPLLFQQRIIPFSKISKITETDYKVNAKIRYPIRLRIYQGRKLRIYVSKEKNILLDSFDISGYCNLINELNRLRGYKDKSLKDSRDYLKNDRQGYIGIIIFAILTTGLVYYGIFFPK